MPLRLTNILTTGQLIPEAGTAGQALVKLTNEDAQNWKRNDPVVIQLAGL